MPAIPAQYVTGVKANVPRIQAQLAKWEERVNTALQNAISAKAKEIHVSVDIYYQAYFSKLRTNRTINPSSADESVQPHIYDYLIAGKEAIMVKEAVKTESGYRGGWGPLSYMNALVPMWYPIEPDGPGQYRHWGNTPRKSPKEKPLWLILEHGHRGQHTIAPRLPGYTGRTEWLFGVQLREGRKVPFILRSFTPRAVPPRPFVSDGIKNALTGVNPSGDFSPEGLANSFATYVVKGFLGGSSKYRVQLREGTRLRERTTPVWSPK